MTTPNRTPPEEFTLRAASIVDHAADLLEEFNFGYSRSGALDAEGNEVSPVDDAAVTLTANGAIYRACFDLRPAFGLAGSYSEASFLLNKRTWELYRMDRFGVLASDLRKAEMPERALALMREWSLEVFNAHGNGG